MLLCCLVSWKWIWPFPTVAVVNSTVVGNARGVVTRQYNHPSDEYLDLFFRFHWQTVTSLCQLFTVCLGLYTQNCHRLGS